MTESVKDKNSESISKKWAHALMELALEDDNISKSDVLDNLRDIYQTIDSSEELKNMVNNPSISTEEKQIVLCKLFQNSMMPLVYNFLFTLNLRKRVNLIGDIVSEFEKELDEINNVKHVSVTSAIELEETRKEDIKNKIASKLASNVEIDWGVDSNIIAGLNFNIDETVIDNSVRHKLEDLSREIIKA